MDIYAEVTARIIDQMENGIIPWEKPWIACGKAVSHATGKAYSLLNQMLLGRPGEYLTFKQCQEAGGRIRKGEKSHMVVFWKWIETEDEETGEKKEVPFLRYYNASLLVIRRLAIKTIDSIYRISVRKTGLKDSKNSRFPET